MEFLAMCAHKTVIIIRQNVAEARAAFRCRWCVKFDSETQKLRYGDVRIYKATESDVRIFEGR